MELAEIAIKYNNVNCDLSNHLKYMNNVALASKNLCKHWTLGDYSVKDKIQRAVFPEGVFIDPVKREYLTNNINLMMLIRPSKSDVSEESKKKQVDENTDLSCQVAGTGLEPMTFGL